MVDFDELWDDEPSGEKAPENNDDPTTPEGEDEEEEFKDPRDENIEEEEDPAKKEGDGGDPDEGDPDDEEEEGDDAGEDDPEGEEEESSFLENFLTKFDVIGGMVDLEEGGSKHIDDMTSEEQDKVLEQLMDHQKESYASEVVSDEEQEFLKGIRENKSVEDIVNEMADRKIMEMNANQHLGEAVDYSAMDADDVFLKYLKDTQPDASEEELSEDLKLAKEAKTYDDTVNILKNQYVQEQDRERQAFLAKEQEAKNQKFMGEAATIVDAARELDSVAGWKLNDEVKNSVLSNLVEKDEKGDSPFMKEISSNPQKMFEAQWYLQYGQKMFDQMSEYYKDLASTQYKKGLQEGQGRKKAPKVSATRVKEEGPAAPKKQDTSKEESEYLSFDDLYNQ